MLAINHTLVGAAIGSETNNIPVVVGLAVASHFVLDALPHIDQGLEKDGNEIFKFNTKYLLASIDVAVSLVLVALILALRPSLNWIPIVVGAISGLSVDLVFNVPLWENFMKRAPILQSIYRFHEAIQEPLKKYRFIFGIPIQTILAIISLVVLLR
jgi:uncharacterized membrane protein